MDRKKGERGGTNSAAGTAVLFLSFSPFFLGRKTRVIGSQYLDVDGGGKRHRRPPIGRSDVFSNGEERGNKRPSPLFKIFDISFLLAFCYHINKNKLCSMTCGGDSEVEQKMNFFQFQDSVAIWSFFHYDFRMGCDPPFLVRRGVTPRSEIIVGISITGTGSLGFAL